MAYYRTLAQEYRRRRDNTAGYVLDVVVHDLNVEVMRGWLAGLGIELPEQSPHVYRYPPGDLPWLKDREERAAIHGRKRHVLLSERTRGGTLVPVRGNVVKKVERLVSLGRVKRVGLTRVEEWPIEDL